MVGVGRPGSGPRRHLNYGHAAGRAIETTSGFTLRHGEAVALGMVYAARVWELLTGAAAPPRSPPCRNASLRRPLTTSCAPVRGAYGRLRLDAPRRRQHRGADRDTRAVSTVRPAPCAWARGVLTDRTCDHGSWKDCAPDSDLLCEWMNSPGRLPCQNPSRTTHMTSRACLTRSYAEALHGVRAAALAGRCPRTAVS
ncbi:MULTISPECIES: 3-dehydroquinate synthase family protein [Streptomyces]|uniref:3-dehydroquinate synthase family protein n=1 Tax=Streptomyces TaxID=1883 RepID=UPI001E2F8DF3|nr:MULTISPECIES: hypothetical protein [Streptomyces]UFQ19614.1 hypothetical protein J2N69_34190 [Streptomyces huasconensis]WCL89232.1 hypothetical protein PPN52_34135 [Streptomyces sp. JCM 35825]